MVFAKHLPTPPPVLSPALRAERVGEATKSPGMKTPVVADLTFGLNLFRT